MSWIHYITGGVASNKSLHAQSFAMDFAAHHMLGPRVAFIATATPCDSEMEEKISAHMCARPKEWVTLETYTTPLIDILSKVDTGVAILDCLTMFVSTRMVLCHETDEKILSDLECAVEFMQSHGCCQLFLVVSNEVGFGIVPNAELGRRFRELLGRANKMMMSAAYSAQLMVSGHPVRIK